jgi:predicted GIY-YIG superfamily endonuclease
MNVELLFPTPLNKQPFRLSHQKFVPARSGCYVLSTFTGLVLYVGLAVDLQRRAGEHLDNPEKTLETRVGRAVWFHWLETADLNKVERTWMNIHIENEGRIPELNRTYSPTAT